MNLELDAMAIELPQVKGHPNRVPFRGVLTVVNAASDRAPSGARGHRVLLTREAAERAIPSLLGMALDYTPTLDGHDARVKVGIITSAEIVGDELRVSGYLFARDFPEVVRQVRAAGGELGMSYELANARVEDTSAAVWKLVDVTFTGAAVLRRKKAAYEQTSIELAADAGGAPASGPVVAWASRPRVAAAAETAAEQPRRSAALQSTDTEENKMNQEQFNAIMEKLAAVAETLSATVARIEGKIAEPEPELTAKIAELEKANAELKRVHAQTLRKTLPASVSTVLAKEYGEALEKLDPATLDTALAGLSVEQRIAVKAQMARVGVIG